MDGPKGPEATFVPITNDTNLVLADYLQELGQDKTDQNQNSIQTTTVIPSVSQLTNCYASSADDFNELDNLLTSWNLGEYFNFFVGMYIENIDHSRYIRVHIIFFHI